MQPERDRVDQALGGLARNTYLHRANPRFAENIRIGAPYDDQPPSAMALIIDINDLLETVIGAHFR